MYSNWVVCYNKFGVILNGLEDVEKCIEFDLKFFGGYIRKVEVEFYLKEYDNVMNIYVEGFNYDFNN